MDNGSYQGCPLPVLESQDYPEEDAGYDCGPKIPESYSSNVDQWGADAPTENHWYQNEGECGNDSLGANPQVEWGNDNFNIQPTGWGDDDEVEETGRADDYKPTQWGEDGDKTKATDWNDQVGELAGYLNIQPTGWDD